MISLSPPTYNKNLLLSITLTVSIGPAGVLETDGKVVIPHCSDEACLIRCTDEFICAFEKEDDARRFHQALGERLKKFNLELSAKKTRITPLSPSGPVDKISFNFLGFEFRWGKDRYDKLRKSNNWGGFRQLLAQFGVVKPHIVNRPRRVRKAFVPGLA